MVACEPEQRANRLKRSIVGPGIRGTWAVWSEPTKMIDTLVAEA
jgi:hypothetical protein